MRKVAWLQLGFAKPAATPALAAPPPPRGLEFLAAAAFKAPSAAERSKVRVDGAVSQTASDGAPQRVKPTGNELLDDLLGDEGMSLFEEADQNQDGMLSTDELGALLPKLHAQHCGSRGSRDLGTQPLSPEDLALASMASTKGVLEYLDMADAQEKRDDEGAEVADRGDAEHKPTPTINPKRRRSIVSSMLDGRKVNFANKTTREVGDPTEWQQIGVGYACRKGLKPESPNQDSFFILSAVGDISIYGVFDGHGQQGHDVSEFVKENLPKVIVSDSRFRSGNSDMPLILHDAFLKMQALIYKADELGKLEARWAGTTGTVVVHDHRMRRLTVAHVSDSAAAIGSCGSGQTLRGMRLTQDHRPENPEEKARIQAAGGAVVFDNYNHRVYAKGNRYPGLNMSRSFGDLFGHQSCGLSCVPEIKVVELAPEDQTLLVCSDGVWEFLSEQDAIDIVEAFEPTDTMAAADKLATVAWDAWIREAKGTVVDDITVVLVRLGLIATASAEAHCSSMMTALDGEEKDRVQCTGC